MSFRSLWSQAGRALRAPFAGFTGRRGAVGPIRLLVGLGIAIGTASAGYEMKEAFAPPAPPPGDTIYHFGPDSMAGAVGAGNTYVEEVTVALAPGERHRLVIWNGTSGGGNRVTSAITRWNNDTVVAAGELTSGDYLVQRLVPGRALDTLTVTVVGASGTYIKLAVISEPDPTFAIFGDSNFVSPNGTNVDTVYFADFVLPATAAPPYYLYLYNGDDAGDYQLAEAQIQLNGAIVVDTDELHAGIGSVVRQITPVADTNHLRVYVKGNTSDVIRLQVRGTDTFPPILTILTPDADSTILSDTVLGTIGQIQSQSAATVTVNGDPTNISAGEWDGWFPISSEGWNTFRYVARNGTGDSVVQLRYVFRDTEPPELTVTLPAESTATQVDSIEVSASWADALATEVYANGHYIDVSGTTGSVWVPLDYGMNVITVDARDFVGHHTMVYRTVFYDTLPPVIAIATPADNATVSGDSVTISGTATDASPVTVTVNGLGATVTAGAFSRKVPIGIGSNVITTVATDAATNTGTDVRDVTRDDSGLPPDPETVATPINPTTPTNLGQSTAFLYTGPDPIQTGVAPGTISPVRAGVVKGRLLDRAGSPVSGVQVTVLDHPELGQTLSRVDGGYDLGVNGGGTLTLDFAGNGYLSSQRSVPVGWQEFTRVDDVVLVSVDTAATTVNFSQPIQAARGSVTTDTSGTRQATLLFEQGTTATAVLPNGTTQPLSTITVRATEFTVGPSGPAAMPAPLPPTSAYTYAAALTIDEAEALGAAQVAFSQPVPFYLENFLGFPTGMKLPLAYYDRGEATWKPEADGRVVEVLGTSGGTASLDVTGSGSASNQTQLDALGITLAEQQQLASLYTVGQKLWRVRLAHFSTIDINLSGQGGDGPNGPNPTPEDDPPEDECNQPVSSFIGCESQSIGERLPIVGTPYQAVYTSRRAQGRVVNRMLRVPVVGSTVPTGLKRAEVTIDIAGQRYQQVFPAIADQVLEFTWDGNDGYGRPVVGAGTANVRVGFVYDGFYQVPGALAESFGQPSGVPTTVPTRQEVIQTRQTLIPLGGLGSAALGIGGWSIDVHHTYDPLSRTFYLGDGRQVKGDVTRTSVGRVAGTGFTGLSGDGGPALDATLSSPRALAVGPDGSIYIGDWGNARVRRISPGGIITTVAGGGSSLADSVPAATAQLFAPRGVAVGPDGSIYIADQSDLRVRRVLPNGTIVNFAGNGIRAVAGDGGPATQASFWEPFGVAVGVDGSVYVADITGFNVRRIAPDGIISTVAGNGTTFMSGDGGPATAAGIGYPLAIAVGPDGAVYIDSYQGGFSNGQVRRIGADGVIQTIAGGGFLAPVSGAIAANVGLFVPVALSVDRNNNVYVAEYTYNRVWKIGSDGILVAAAGNGSGCYYLVGFDTCGDGGLPTQASFTQPTNTVTAPDGRLLITQIDNNILRSVAPVRPGFTGGGLLISAGSDTELYETNLDGRHLRTIEAYSGAIVRSFEYDSLGQLVAVQEGDSARVTIERATNGAPIAINGVDGQRTELTTTPEGLLQMITDPGGNAYTFTYASGGVISSITDPNNHSSVYEHDSLGRLISATDASGASRIPVRTADLSGVFVSIASAEGVTPGYRFETLASGATRRVFTSPAGDPTVTQSDQNGLVTTTEPSGTIYSLKRGPDSRVGMQAPSIELLSVRAPSGLTATISGSRSSTLSDPGDPLSVTVQVDSFIMNGRVYQSTWNTSTRTLVYESPTGREVTREFDSQDRLISMEVPGFSPSTYEYDSRGRVKRTTQGSRITQYTYDTKGRLATSTDAAGRVTAYFYDSSDRLIKRVLPGNREVLYTYDSKGNVTTIAPPGRPAHAVTYSVRGQATGYSPPALDTSSWSTEYVFDRDRRPTQVIHPHASMTLQYDSAGRLSDVGTAQGSMRFGYGAGTGKLTSMVSPTGDSLLWNYDGNLPVAATSTGAVPGRVDLAYDSNFWVVGQRVNGTANVSFEYDDDGLLTDAGLLSLERDPASGVIVGTQVGTVESRHTYSVFAEPESLIVESGLGTLYRSDFVRDALGRVTSLAEEIGGITTTFDMIYDLAGRLQEVSRNGTVSAVFAYDSNSNRTTVTRSSGVLVASYDDQDRLLAINGTSYEYGKGGDLARRFLGADTTSFDYDVLGNLIGVGMPDGTEIEYLVDSRGRRVGKKVNGTLVRGFLYLGQYSPIAETNASGQIVSRFIYATRPNVPDYMVKGGDVFRLVLDHLGSVRLVVNAATGAVVQRLDFDEYGQVLTNTNPDFQPFGFAGGMTDSHTGLVRFGKRDYDPFSGRWTSRDVLGLDGDGPNAYEYAASDPINNVDVDGLSYIKTVRLVIQAGKIIGFTPGAKITLKAAIRLRQAGRNVCVAANNWLDARRLGKKIETAAHGTEKLKHHPKDFHKNGGNQPHFQTGGVTGHTWYKALSALALTTYFEDNLLAEVADFFNPLSLGKDIADLYDALESGGAEEIEADGEYCETCT